MSGGKYRKRAGEGRGVGERFVPLVHSVLDSEAWAALSPLGRALFVELRRQVHVTRPWENNGRVHLSVRQAAAKLQSSPRKIRESFYDLQRLGFIVVTQIGYLGAEGHGKATLYRLTDCGCRNHRRGSREFEGWRPGRDYRVVMGPPPRRAAAAGATAVLAGAADA